MQCASSALHFVFISCHDIFSTLVSMPAKKIIPGNPCELKVEVTNDSFVSHTQSKCRGSKATNEPFDRNQESKIIFQN